MLVDLISAHDGQCARSPHSLSPGYGHLSGPDAAPATGIASPANGRAYADSFRGTRFELVADAARLPQIEQPAATFALIAAFAKGKN